MTKLYAFPATIQADELGNFCVSFEGLPGATWGETREDALQHAQDLLVTAIEMLIQDGDPIPSPPPADGRPIVEASVG